MFGGGVEEVGERLRFTRSSAGHARGTQTRMAPISRLPQEK